MNLTTERLILREFRREDWPAVLAYQQDPRYLRYYPWESRTEREVRAFVEMFLLWQQEEPRLKFQLAVILPDEGRTPQEAQAVGVDAVPGRLIGNVGVRRRAPGSREADIGYEIAPECWGHGYASEAARTMLDFAFREMGVQRVWAEVIAENTASQRVLEKIGLRLEKHLPGQEWMKGRWWDKLIYAIYRYEWEARQIA